MTKNFGKLLRRAFACFLVVVMTLSAVPMSGFVGLEMPKWSQLFATKVSAEDELTPEDCVDISTEDDSLYCYPVRPNVVTKLSFAVEELYMMKKKRPATLP